MEQGQQLELEGHVVNDTSSSFLIALEELRNLRPQLMTAAEYCEQQYLGTEQKDGVGSNLRDYAVKALVNVVDHLGTVAYKLNLCIDQETSRIETSDLQMMALQQRIASMRTYMEQDAAKQQQQPKAAQRMVKQYRVPDATAEAAFAAAQVGGEMPREVFDLAEKGWSESVYSLRTVAPSQRRSSFTRRKSESGTKDAPRRNSISSGYHFQGSPASPPSSTVQPGSPTASTGSSWTRSSSFFTSQRPGTARSLRPQLSGASQGSESPDVSSSSTRLGKGGSKLRRMLSGLLTRTKTAEPGLI